MLKNLAFEFLPCLLHASKREQILQVNSKDCPNCVVVVFVVLFLVLIFCFVFVCVYQGRIHISEGVELDGCRFYQITILNYSMYSDRQT